MTLKQYIEACNKFANDSADWGGLDPYKHYVAFADGEWAESCDNQEDGIHLEWAFGLGPGEINDVICRDYYVSEYKSELRVAENDGWDADQRRKLYEKYEDCIVNSEGHIFCDMLDAITDMMDDGIRERLVSSLSCSTVQEFFTAYAAAHKEEFGEQWELDKANPTW